MNDEIYEALLDTWLRMTAVISNRRLVKSMSFNEAVICRLLKEAKENNIYLTATDLCNQTKMLKSLMNSTINSLEKKKMIQRIRSTKDKRQFYLELNEDNIDVYQKEHRRIIELLKETTKELEVNELQSVMKVLSKITDGMEKYYGN